MWLGILAGIIGHKILWFLVGFFGAIWAGLDASERGKPGILVFIVVTLLGPFGILMWIAFRPERR